MSDVKWMDLREFYESGYLQEVNRLFFHPLGLALAIEMDDDDPSVPVTIKGVWDYRDDPEGMYFNWDTWQTPEENEVTRIKAERVEAQRSKLRQSRAKILGFDIEPLPGESDGSTGD